MSITIEDMLTAEWLTVRQAAIILDVTEQSVYRWIRQGQLPALRLGSPRSATRIRRSDLEAFIQNSYARMQENRRTLNTLRLTVLNALIDAGDWVNRSDIAAMTGLEPDRVTYAFTRMRGEGALPCDVDGVTRDRRYRANADTIAYVREYIDDQEAA